MNGSAPQLSATVVSAKLNYDNALFSAMCGFVFQEKPDASEWKVSFGEMM